VKGGIVTGLDVKKFGEGGIGHPRELVIVHIELLDRSECVDGRQRACELVAGQIESCEGRSEIAGKGAVQLIDLET